MFASSGSMLRILFRPPGDETGPPVQVLTPISPDQARLLDTMRRTPGVVPLIHVLPPTGAWAQQPPLVSSGPEPVAPQQPPLVSGPVAQPPQQTPVVPAVATPQQPPVARPPQQPPVVPAVIPPPQQPPVVPEVPPPRPVDLSPTSPPLATEPVVIPAEDNPPTPPPDVPQQPAFDRILPVDGETFRQSTFRRSPDGSAFLVLNQPVTDSFTADQLAPYLDVCGNKYGGLYFLAIKFKHPVVVRKSFGVFDRNPPLQLDLNSIVAVDAAQEYRVSSQGGGLVLQTDDMRVAGGAIDHRLLRNLFPYRNFAYEHYHNRELYLVARHNPFLPIWRKCNKTAAFHALCHLYEACVAKSYNFGWYAARLMQHFHRRNDISVFSSWYPMAREMCREEMAKFCGKAPTLELARTFQKICDRNRILRPDSLAPPEFYTCQITLSDAEPVGLACRIVEDKVEHVSVMVVSHTTQPYRDTTGMICRFWPGTGTEERVDCQFWFPFYQNSWVWESFGLEWYVRRDLDAMQVSLTGIIDWLRVQTAEPYLHMRRDLVQVYEILYGEVEPRWRG